MPVSRVKKEIRLHIAVEYRERQHEVDIVIHTLLDGYEDDFIAKITVTPDWDTWRVTEIMGGDKYISETPTLAGLQYADFDNPDQVINLIESYLDDVLWRAEHPALDDLEKAVLKDLMAFADECSVWMSVAQHYDNYQTKLAYHQTNLTERLETYEKQGK